MKNEVLCAASAYEKKYYFNNKFSKLPDDVKDELQILCVSFTEEVGGVITLEFSGDGTLRIETMCDDGDLLYDDIGSGLLIRRMQKEKSGLFESLEMYYRLKTQLGEEEPGGEG